MFKLTNKKLSYIISMINNKGVTETKKIQTFESSFKI